MRSILIAATAAPILATLLLPAAEGAETSKRMKETTEIAQIGATEAKEISIPAGSLAEALNQLAKQTGADLVYRPEQVKDIKTHEIKGHLTTADAISRLLEGTQLQVSTSAAGAYIIATPKTTAVLPLAGDGSGRLRLAQAEPSQSQGVAEEKTSQGSSLSSSESQDESGDSTDTFAIPEILVRGSRIQNADIQRTIDDALPYVTFGSVEIEKSGATNLEEFFRSKLTMNASVEANSQRQSPDGTSSNESSIDLRGFGSSQTLILVDGRRAPRSGNGIGDFIQADINGIPLAAIERIEILPSSAGGIYGGGAIGGVINIIRKRNYSGVDVQADMGGAFHGGAESVQVGLNGGFSLEGGLTQISFSGSYSETEPLLTRENDLWKRARARFLAAPASPFVPDQNKATLILGSTPRVCAAFVFGLQSFCDTFGTLSLSGNDLGVTVTSMPDGYSGVASDGGAALLADPGHLNLDLSPQDAEFQLHNAPTVISGNLNVRRELGAMIDAFVDLSAFENRATSNALPIAAIGLRAGQPGNPFDSDVQVTLPLPGVSADYHSRSTTAAVTGGLIIRLNSLWSISPEASWGRAATKLTTLRSPLDIARLQADAEAGVIDVFRDLRANPIDFSPYLRAFPDSSQDAVNIQRTGSVRVAGPLLQIAGGPVRFTGLLEARADKAEPWIFQSQAPPLGDYSIYYPGASQDVYSSYAELVAPIFSQSNAVPLLRSLELMAALRYDAYSTKSPTPPFIESFDPGAPLPDIQTRKNEVDELSYTIAQRWEPVEGVAIRASYATGFLPPSILQIVPTAPIGPFDFSFFIDPLRMEPLGNVTFQYGGNADLEPEESKSYSFGLVLKPKFAHGARLSVDYTRIAKRGQIETPPLDYLLNNEDALPGRVVRAPGDGVTPGPITHFDLTLVNLAKREMKAIDLRLDFAIDSARYGSFMPYVMATQQRGFLTQRAQGDPSYDSAGYHDGPLKWRVSAGINWNAREWSASWATQYFDSYQVSSADPTLSLGNASAILAQGSDRIESQMYHDVGVRYWLGTRDTSWLSGVELAASIQNVFDKRPPVDVSSGTLGLPLTSYSTYGDPRLRRFLLSVKKRFGQ